jgi:Holliday junction resolvasome RuvABC endonuclease subunit
MNVTRPRKPEFTGRILTLDLATHLGWCLGAPTDEPTFGAHVLGHKLTRPQALQALDRWLTAELKDHKPDLVVAEEAPNPAWLGKNASASSILLLNGLVSRAEEVCERRRVEFRTVKAIRWKASLGVAKANKKQKPYPVITQVGLRGWRVTNDNTADAIGLWLHVVSVKAPIAALRFDPLTRRAAASGLCMLDTASGRCGVHQRPWAACQKGVGNEQDSNAPRGRRRRAVG